MIESEVLGMEERRELEQLVKERRDESGYNEVCPGVRSPGRFNASGRNCRAAFTAAYRRLPLRSKQSTITITIK